MLVLSRKRNEIIYIVNEDTGEVITLCVTDIRGNVAKIGLDGDKKYKFIRKELHARCKEQPKEVPAVEEIIVDKSIHFN